MPSERQPSPYVVFGITNQPLGCTVPPVDAQPQQPLPDAGPFLRVCAGGQEPTTALLRCARELDGEWRHVHEHGGNASAEVNEQLNLLIWLIDREAGGHTSGIVFEADAPVLPSSYGDWVARLMWKSVLYALRQYEPEHHERDATELMACVRTFDQLVADVQAGRVRLPEQAGASRPRVGRPRGEDVT
ncbi:hypothetical protein IU450_32855 [Nocardia abscessus]|uniref:hypothetical protein n=1 Tax=Nocardia abscessus TaxID=120957 RepID=UPI0018944920|nr:hypothetical protein [Nocardia abscessus]MBF6340651.1 hypothetical protein [Nocardia abscessus]